MSRTSGAGREQGYSVPAEAVNNANSRLLRYLQDPGMMSIRYSDDTRPANLLSGVCFAGAGASAKAPLGALREIWERHAQAASGLPLMQLGMALKLMGMHRAASRRWIWLSKHPVTTAETGWRITAASCVIMP